jgi:hypothetical protein
VLLVLEAPAHLGKGLRAVVVILRVRLVLVAVVVEQARLVQTLLLLKLVLEELGQHLQLLDHQ